VIGLTKSIAADFVRQGIRCNAVCPGTVIRLRCRTGSTPCPTGAGAQGFHRAPAHGRLGTVDDITGLLVFLASDESCSPRATPIRSTGNDDMKLCRYGKLG